MTATPNPTGFVIEPIKFRYITPAVENAGWSKSLFRFEYYYTAGKINVREGEAARGKGKKVDYLLFYNTNTPIAIVEAKDANHEVAGGLQQAIDYARDLDVKFAYSSNGDGFYEHDLITGEEREIKMEEFPSPDDLWMRYRKESGFNDEQTKIITEPYYYDASYNIEPRYYQRIAINRTVEAVAKGQKRILLVMATGTGKTFTAFQIVHRLKKSGKVNRVLYLADRNILIDLNVKGVFVCAQSAAKIMKEQGGGVIINASSMVSIYGQPSGCGYPTSKFAVNGLTKSLARELAKDNIRVNAVAPGVTNTDMVAALPKELVNKISEEIPLGRVGEPTDVANAYLYLASDLASYVTGEILQVDGAARA